MRMEEKHGPKWYETGERIEQVALEMIEHSNLDHVSVRAVCERANVNRSTFYEHCRQYFL